MSSPEVGRTLLQAGLHAVTGRTFSLDGAGVPEAGPDQFRQMLLQRAVREKMMPMLAHSARERDLGLGDVPDRLTEVYRLITREQYTHLRPALDELARRSLPVIVIKGADLDLAVYEKRFPRVMGDIDLLVRPADAPAVLDVFRGQGFIQGKMDRDLVQVVPLSDEEREDFETGSIELAEVAKVVAVPDLLPFRDVIDRHLSYWRMVPLQDAYHLAIGYDIHLHLSLDFDLEDAWSNVRTIDFPETGPCLAQSFTEMAWYLAVRLYHELHLNSAFVLRAFLDVLAIVHRRGGELDWHRIAFVADKYGLHPPLYYVFWHIRELLGEAAVPQELIESLCPTRTGAERGHDWGDFVPRMLGSVQVSPILSGG